MTTTINLGAFQSKSKKRLHFRNINLKDIRLKTSQMLFPNRIKENGVYGQKLVIPPAMFEEYRFV
jgi:hypothetical protein